MGRNRFWKWRGNQRRGEKRRGKNSSWYHGWIWKSQLVSLEGKRVFKKGNEAWYVYWEDPIQ